MNDNRRMLSRWMAFGVWAVVAVTAAYWGLKLLNRPSAVPAQAVVVAPSPPPGDLARLFGAAPPPVVAEAAPVAAPASNRFQLIGVVAAPGGTSRGTGGPGGLALIAVDGKPPRAFRVGAVVDGENVVQSVAPRQVSIGPKGGVALVSLQLPGLPPPATGVPTPAAGLPAPPSFTPPPPFQNPGAAVPSAPQVRPPIQTLPFGRTGLTPMPAPIAPGSLPAPAPAAAGNPNPFGVTPPPGQAPAMSPFRPTGEPQAPS